jgi:hypothetical protein
MGKDIFPTSVVVKISFLSSTSDYVIIELFLREYEDRFEKEYGYFRPVIQEVVEKYLDCGNPMSGFARIA